jgi:glycine cleavage system H protein
MLSVIRRHNNFINLNLNLYRNLYRNCSTKKYTETHEWIMASNETNTIKLGLSNEAIKLMDEIVYIDFDNIEIDKIYEKNEIICEIESVKSVQGIYSPIDSKVISYNEELIDNLDEFNKDPENDKHWIIELCKI